MPGRRHRANAQRPLDPGANEPHLVVETDAPLLLELADLLLDALADAVALLLEKPNSLSDLALNDVLVDFEEAKLPPDFLLELL